MKLLFDQNLSHRLVADLALLFPGSAPVRDLGFKEADDEEIWQYAAAQGFTIVSKDADFHQRSFLYGHPPKVIWLRIGNCSTAAIETLLTAHHSDLLLFEQDASASFLALS